MIRYFHENFVGCWTSLLNFLYMDREDITCQDVSTVCECAVRHCRCNDTDTGMSALELYMSFDLLLPLLSDLGVSACPEMVI